MAEQVDPYTILTEVDGATVLVSLFVPGNDAYEQAVSEAGLTGKKPRAPTEDEVARAVEVWRRQEGSLEGIRKQRRPTEIRTLYP